jgi:hypothetical protein
VTLVTSAPRVDEIERIAAGENPVLQNLEITEGGDGVRLHEEVGHAFSIGGDEIVVGAERRLPRCYR